MKTYQLRSLFTLICALLLHPAFAQQTSFTTNTRAGSSSSTYEVVDIDVDYSKVERWNSSYLGYTPRIEDGVLKSSNPFDVETGEY